MSSARLGLEGAGAGASAGAGAALALAAGAGSAAEAAGAGWAGGGAEPPHAASATIAAPNDPTHDHARSALSSMFFDRRLL